MRTILLLLAGTVLSAAQTPEAPAQIPLFAERVKGMTALPGYFPMYYEPTTGRIFLAISRWNSDFLYVHSLRAGVGANDIGLDRGEIGGSLVLRFARYGPKVLLVEPNQSYRAVTPDALERRAVEESFAQSVIWGFTVEAEDGDRVLVDATN